MNGRDFFFAPDGRLRAGWRIALFFLVASASAAMTQGLLGRVIEWALLSLGVTGAADSVVLMMALLFAHLFMVRVVDRRAMSEVWLGGDAARPVEWAKGFAIGALAIGIPTALLIAIGWLTKRPGIVGGPGGWFGAAFRLSVLLLPAALGEELLARGYLLAALRDAFGWNIAIAITSIGFGMLHLANPGADSLSIALVTLAGIFLATIVWATRSLYAAWMTHFAWNITMAVFFHVAVSGLPMETPGYRYVAAGPAWVTGGRWGPEGGLAGGLGMLGGLTFLIARRRRREET